MDKGKGNWKSFFTKDNMVILTLLGILLLVIALPVGQDDRSSASEYGLSDTSGDSFQTGDPFEQENQETQLELRLASFLSCMEGAGEVKVLITYAASEEQIVEKDLQSPGWQEISQASQNSIASQAAEETVYMTDQQGLQTPYVKKTLAASVEGVTVLAQGGDSPDIQKQITEMIEALFGIEAHKIRVAKMK